MKLQLLTILKPLALPRRFKYSRNPYKHRDSKKLDSSSNGKGLKNIINKSFKIFYINVD